MRIDNKGNSRTLEEDIREIWSLHGWEIIEERVSGNTWEITAKAKSSKPSLNSGSKKDCLKCFAYVDESKKCLFDNPNFKNGGCGQFSSPS